MRANYHTLELTMVMSIGHKTALCFQLAIIVAFQERTVLVHGACSFPTALIGSWYKANTREVATFTSTDMSGPVVTVTTTDYSDYTCHESSGDSYVIKLLNSVVAEIGNSNGYLCWHIYKVTTGTFILKELTPVAPNGAFVNFRMVEVNDQQSAPSFSTVCSLSDSSQVPTLLYTVAISSETNIDVNTISDVAQQCPSDLFYTYSYIKDGSGCSSFSSSLDFCQDRITANVDYTKCATYILYSQNGVLSCVASSTVNNIIYVFLVNSDSTVTLDNSHFFRFACIAVDTTSYGSVTIYPDDCTSISSHTLSVTVTDSCPLGDDSINAGIIAGPIVAIVTASAIIIVALIILKKKGIIGRRTNRTVTPTPGKEDKPEDKPYLDHIPASHHILPANDYVKCVQEYVGLIIALSCLPTADVQPDGRLPPIDDMEKTPPLRQ